VYAAFFNGRNYAMPTEVATSAWNVWSGVAEFLKLVPGLVLFPITLMLAWKKIGHKAMITYSVSHDRYTAPHLSNIVLTNCKDKPLIVHALYIIVDRHVLLPLKEFDPPLVVKGLESTVIESEPASSYHVGGHPFEISFGAMREVYVLTTGSSFKCEADPTPRLATIAKEGDYQTVQADTHTYNSHVYNHSVRYAMMFSVGEKGYTAFIDVGGHIGLEWPFQVNHLTPEQMTDAATVKTTLEGEYGEFLGASLIVHTLSTSNPFSKIESA
jgi:hypothetical protein